MENGFRVSTPPLVKQYRKKAQDLDGGIFPFILSSSEAPDSPNSLTAGGHSSSAFSSTIHLEHTAKHATSTTGKHLIFFSTGVRVADIPDSSKYPPSYRSQYTVTGEVRRTKEKREGGPVLGRAVNVNEHAIALFHFKGRIFAIENKCCHQGGPLWEGDIEELGHRLQGKSVGDPTKPCVSCPWHGWVFDLETGACMTQPSYSQKVYPCIVDRGIITVGFEDFNPDTFSESAFDF